MGNIPIIQAQRSSLNATPDVSVSANAFGAQIGGAVAALGNTVRQVADDLAPYELEKRKQKINEEVAYHNSQFNLTEVEMKTREKASPDGEGYLDQFKTEGDNAIQEYADKNFKDPEARKQFLETQRTRLGQKLEQGAVFVAGEREARSKLLAEDTINALINKVGSDPTEYENALKDMNTAIDGRPMPEAKREVMKIDAKAELITSRFSGALGAVTTKEGYDALAAELEKPEWAGALKPSQFEKLQRDIRTSKSAFISGQDAKARGMLDSMEARSKDRVVIPSEELRELGQLARDSGSAAVQTRYAKLRDQQDMLQGYGKLPVQTIDREIQRQETDLADNGDVGKWASDAAALTGGSVSASYLINKLGREYSEADLKAGRYNEPNKAGASSARGLFQFIDGTWLGMVKNNASQLGVSLIEDGRPLSDAQILALRGDPALNTKVAALYARDNSDHIYKALGFRPGPTELYIAHFLGPAGAVSFLSMMRNNPDEAITAAGSFSQGQIDANGGVFKNKDGSMKSFRDVYENIAADFNGEKSAIVADRLSYLRDMRDNKEKQLQDDPMTVAQQDGRYQPYDLNTSDDWARLGRDASENAAYYNIPMSDMKPLTNQQLDLITKQIKEGDADTVLGIMTNMQSMGAEMSRAAYKQIGQKDPTFEYAAGLAAERGGASVATDIVRGTKRLEEDKSMRDLVGANDAEMAQSFFAATGSALSSASPRVRDQIAKAALAHYVETAVSRGTTAFDKTKYEASVAAVLGGEGTVGKVNGEVTVLPKGIDAETFDTALQSMTVEDYKLMSANGQPPRYNDGRVAGPVDIDLEGKFRAIGANSYYVEMADGFLFDGTVDSKGRGNRYVFVANPSTLKGIAARPEVEAAKKRAEQDAALPDNPAVAPPANAPLSVNPLMYEPTQ